MKKNVLLVIILAVVIVILIAVLAWPINKAKAPSQKPAENIPPVTQIVEGIVVTSPKANDVVSSPIKIKGTTNAGGWSGFEGQVGTVQLLDYKGNKVAQGILTATTEWTKPPVSFESTLTFQTKVTGPMTLLFSNENPSGIPDKDKKFGLPIIVK